MTEATAPPISDEQLAELIQLHDSAGMACPWPWTMTEDGPNILIRDGRGEVVGRAEGGHEHRDVPLLRFICSAMNQLADVLDRLGQAEARLGEAEGLLRDMAEDGKAVELMRQRRAAAEAALEWLAPEPGEPGERADVRQMLIDALGG